jgi:integrase
VAHIQVKRTDAGTRYQARWTDNHGKHKAKFFTRKADAERFLAATVTDLERGSYIDPAPYTVADAAERWLATKRRLTPATRSGYVALIETHILPKLGEAKLARLLPSDVETFIGKLEAERAPATVRNAYFLLKGILDLAIRDRRLTSNPVVGVELPPQTHREMLFLDSAQVEALADAIRPAYRTLVLFAAYTGLRAGEISALRVAHLDLDVRRQVHVRESATSVKGQGIVTGPTKTKATRRVPIPAFLLPLLKTQIDGKAPEEYVFTSLKGGQLNSNTFYKVCFQPAVVRSLPPELHRLRFHDLRHTTASLLIRTGAHPKAVSTYLGHSTINITMDRYGHLYPDDLAALGAALDSLRSAAPASGAAREVVSLR